MIRWSIVIRESLIKVWIQNLQLAVIVQLVSMINFINFLTKFSLHKGSSTYVCIKLTTIYIHSFIVDCNFLREIVV